MLKRIEQFLATNPDIKFESEAELWMAFFRWRTGKS